MQNDKKKEEQATYLTPKGGRIVIDSPNEFIIFVFAVCCLALVVEKQVFIVFHIPMRVV